MEKEEFDKLEWKQYSYKVADYGSCTWESCRWDIERQVVQPFKNGKPFGKSRKAYFYREKHITFKKLLEIMD